MEPTQNSNPQKNSVQPRASYMEPKSVTLTNDHSFVPPTLNLKVGELVRWENNSDEIHTITCDMERASSPDDIRLPEDAQPFHSGPLNPGEDFEYQFLVPGRYVYVCLYHQEMNMRGEVLVEA